MIAFKEIAFRLIDREHVAAFLLFCVLCLVGLVLYRIPAEALGAIPAGLRLIFYSGPATTVILSWALAMSLCTNAVLITVAVLVQRVYRNEIDRMAAHKRDYETGLDPERPPTFAPSEHPPFLGPGTRGAPISSDSAVTAEPSSADDLEKAAKNARKRG